MGEKVAEGWSPEEIELFLTIVELYPQSKGLDFWGPLKRAFASAGGPEGEAGGEGAGGGGGILGGMGMCAEGRRRRRVRSVKELVSFYFNVFVLRRRALQNRIPGMEADSDDDETELVVQEEEEGEDEEEEGVDGRVHGKGLILGQQIQEGGGGEVGEGEGDDEEDEEEEDEEEEEEEGDEEEEMRGGFVEYGVGVQ
ncbi:unnamed protein product, partial [Closterium sp. NIES-54]